jgi:hypothetical protein
MQIPSPLQQAIFSIWRLYPSSVAETSAVPFRAATTHVSSFLGSPLGVHLSGSERYMPLPLERADCNLGSD